MKKWLCIFLIALMMVGGNIQSLSFAAEESSADLLFKYGFIVGDNGDLMLDKNLTRAQACVLLSEMYGKKDEASKYIFIQNFTDVQTKDWFAPYITFAKTNKWISGYPDGTFKPNNAVSRQEWSAMLMNALEYSYEWENVILDMNTIGIDFSAKNPMAVKRGEAFVGMWKALLTPARSETVALGIKLNKLPADIISNSSNSTGSNTASGTLDVVSYRAVGLNELEFVFNKKLEDNSNLFASNITMQQETNFFLKPIKVNFTDDKMGIRVITNVPIIQNKSMGITLTDIVASDGSQLMDKRFTDIKFMDATLPQMISAEIIGDYYIKVVFNEPVESDEDIFASSDADSIPELSISNFIIDEKRVNLNKVVLTDNNKTAIIHTNTKLTGDVTISAKNMIKDFAGFNLYSTQITAKYTKDITPPKVVSARIVDSKQVVIVWDENIKTANTDMSLYYHDSPAYTIGSKLPEGGIDGKELTLDFANHPLSSGANTVYVLNGSISDYFGNTNVTQSAVVQLAADVTSPKVTGDIEVKDSKTVVIHFSEAMRNNSNELYVKSNYEVKDSNNKSVEMSQTIYDSKQNALTLYFATNLSGTYTLKINNLFDTAGNALVDSGHQFIAKDMSLPSAMNWSAKVFFTDKTEQNIIVFYDEPMSTSGNYSILDKSKYKINGKRLGDLDASKVRLNLIDDKTVQITVGTLSYGGMDITVDDNDTASYLDLAIAKVADANGNVTETDDNYVDLKGKSSIKVLGFRYIGNDQCEILLSEKVVDIDVKDFDISKNGIYYSIKTYSIEYNDKNQSIVTITLNQSMNTYLGFFMRAAGQNTKTVFGETLSPIADYVPLTEFIGASLAKTTYNGSYVDDVTYTESTGIITMEFTQVLNPNSVFMLSFEIPGIEIEKIVTKGAFVQIYVEASERTKVKQYMSIIQKYPMKDINDISIEGIQTRIEMMD